MAKACANFGTNFSLQKRWNNMPPKASARSEVAHLVIIYHAHQITNQSSGRFHPSLLATIHTLQITHHSPQIIHQSLQVTQHILQITHHAKQITHHSLEIIHHAQEITHHLRVTTHWKSLIYHSSDFTHHSHRSLQITHHSCEITHHPLQITHCSPHIKLSNKATYSILQNACLQTLEVNGVKNLLCSNT